VKYTEKTLVMHPVDILEYKMVKYSHMKIPPCLIHFSVCGKVGVVVVCILV